MDLTILNNQPIGLINDWAKQDQESCTDHNIIKYGLSNTNTITEMKGNNKGGVSYRMEERDIAKFK